MQTAWRRCGAVDIGPVNRTFHLHNMFVRPKTIPSLLFLFYILHASSFFTDLAFWFFALSHTLVARPE